MEGLKQEGRPRRSALSWRPLLLRLPPGADAPDLLFGSRSRGFEQSREGPRRPHDRLQQMEPLGPPRLVAVEPPGDLGTLLAIHGDQRVAFGGGLFLDMEERFAVDRRQE